MNDFFSYSSIFKRLGHSRTQLLLGILANMGYHKFYSRLLKEHEHAAGRATGGPTGLM